MSTIVVLEASWEVCNKVGGIYTVVVSKARSMLAKFPEDYVCVGPYNPSSAAAEFKEQQPPPAVAHIFNELAQEGIVCHYGTWEIPGKPPAILIDSSATMRQANTIKREMWERYGVDSLGAGYDYDEPLVWSYCVGKLAERYATIKENVVLHAHEWLAGSALLYTKAHAPAVQTVFTTHATVLGRSISGAWGNLYDTLHSVDPASAARTLNVHPKHDTERASALTSDVFTTVSHITGEEARILLGRAPDVILPNGLSFQDFPDAEDVPIMHKRYRTRIREFLMAYFFPYYSFDLEHTLLLYTSGRYEYTNKGLDVTIDALSQLNTQLKQDNSKRTIVMFFFIPAGIGSIRYDLLQTKALFEDVQDSLDEYGVTMKRMLLTRFAEQRNMGETNLLDEEFSYSMKRMMLSFKREGIPQLSTHNLLDEAGDPIVNACRKAGLLNRKEDRIKVVFYPGYLSSSDGLLNLDYHQAVLGCHFGIFPSGYEPWGYTPLESAGYGVPALTTDYSGLGAYLKTHSMMGKGISVVERAGKTSEEVVAQIRDTVRDYAYLPHAERIEQKHLALKTAHAFDWSKLSQRYFEAYAMLDTKRP